MRNSLALLLLSTAAFLSPAYATGNDKNYVLVETTDAGTTSELLDMPIGASPSLSQAQISMKYFGPQSDSDISVVLTLEGAKNRYSADETLGARFYAGDTPLSKSKYRMIGRVTKQGVKDIINTHLTLEEVAWLARNLPLIADTREVELSGIFPPGGSMKKSKFSETQIVAILKQGDGGVPIKDLCRQAGISTATYYQWKSKYGGMEASDLRRVKELEAENAKLKRMYAEQALDIAAMKELIAKKL
jgi:putative transposase